MERRLFFAPNGEHTHDSILPNHWNNQPGLYPYRCKQFSFLVCQAVVRGYPVDKDRAACLLKDSSKRMVVAVLTLFAHPGVDKVFRRSDKRALPLGWFRHVTSHFEIDSFVAGADRKMVRDLLELFFSRAGSREEWNDLGDEPRCPLLAQEPLLSVSGR